ncbi:MAG: hypothetical protein WC208_16085 [Gallionella sp.]|jgi:hypothetical protein
MSEFDEIYLECFDEREGEADPKRFADALIAAVKERIRKDYRMTGFEEPEYLNEQACKKIDRAFKELKGEKE